MKSAIELIQFEDNRNLLKFVGRGGLTSRSILHEGIFDQIISLDNLFTAWSEFRRGKRSKPDVQIFEYTLEDNIFQLHQDLVTGAYCHGSYQQFQITDPKVRLISKSSVRDRLLHHAIYRTLYPAWDRTFIYDSYSCRNNKGTYKAFARLIDLTRKVSGNYTRPCWALKLDIRKFFDSVDHEILMDLLKARIVDEQLLKLLRNIIDSFEHSPDKGMPLGNLTSQLFANIYLDPLDKFVKRKLKVKYYLRYADDFTLLDTDLDRLLGYLIEINRFLKDNLELTLHPGKIILRKLNWGIDFVGYIALSHYNLPRKSTVKRIFRTLTHDMQNNADLDKSEQSLNSYLGYLKYVNAYNLSQELVKTIRLVRQLANQL